MIPLLDLQSLNASMQSEIEAAILRVARSGRYILGPEVELFENAWANYCGTQYCIGTANALQALEILLRANDIGPGDEVLVPANTYIATWLAITHVGAKPVPVEADLESCNLDPSRMEEKITSRTRAVIAVHLYGRVADMYLIDKTARRHGLLVFEDAAQAHGAGDGQFRAGSLGDGAAFSFYPSKNLGALGDAGAITTNDSRVAQVARRMRNYGGVGRLDHRIIGVNSRLDEMQAAILMAKLPFLKSMNDSRRARARAYDSVLDHLSGFGLHAPMDDEGHVYHQYVIRVESREILRQKLLARGIDCHVHYPTPPYLEGAYLPLGIKHGSFKVTEKLADEVLSLPIGNDVDATAIAHVVEEVYLKEVIHEA